MTLWERVVEANRPGPPEPSVPFRTASAAAVVVGSAACWRQGELGPAMAAFTVVAVVVGNVLSYRRRERPWPWIKPILAVAAVGGFAWFIVTVSRSATPGDISTVERPLAVLFAWILATHSFDVPARRDVAYSLAGSTALVAVAAAQSVDLALGGFVLVWLACCLWGLVAMWQSMAGARGVPWRTLALSGAVVAGVAGILVALLPAPRVSATLAFPSASAGSQVDSPTNLTDGSASLPAHAASASGPTRVGGYLGFARSLDTGVRAPLGNQVVLRVRATRPNFWVGQTYDEWTGRDWLQSADPVHGNHVVRLDTGSPFAIPLAPDQAAPAATGGTDVQTFYLAESGPNLVFHADNAERVYLQSRALYLTGDGTIVSSTSMGAGTIYTVVSNDTTATAAQLRAATVPVPAGSPGAPPALDPAQQARYLQLPHPDPRVAALAAAITAGIWTPGGADPHTYDTVQAVEGWMRAHIHYTTAIPPLPAGADAVDSFLFGSRLGYCEQISTATVVLLRTLGIPAREAVGYVPGPYNPITDLYDVQAKDAHAWVQVWFPGYGWQNFDPTAVVPLANPSPGSVLAHQAGAFLARLPWLPLGLLVAVAGLVGLLVRRRRRRPPTWAHQVAADLARGGARLGCPRRPHETLTAYGLRLAGIRPEIGDDLRSAVDLVERATYGGIEPSAVEIATALAVTKGFRSAAGRGGRGGRGGRRGRPGCRPGRRAGSPQVDAWASASAKEAPAASRGR